MYHIMVVKDRKKGTVFQRWNTIPRSRLFALLARTFRPGYRADGGVVGITDLAVLFYRLATRALLIARVPTCHYSSPL